MRLAYSAKRCRPRTPTPSKVIDPPYELAVAASVKIVAIKNASSLLIAILVELKTRVRNCLKPATNRQRAKNNAGI